MGNAYAHGGCPATLFGPHPRPARSSMSCHPEMQMPKLSWEMRTPMHLVRATPAPGAQLHGHRAGHHVTGRQVLPRAAIVIQWDNATGRPLKQSLKKKTRVVFPRQSINHSKSINHEALPQPLAFALGAYRSMNRSPSPFFRYPPSPLRSRSYKTRSDSIRFYLIFTFVRRTPSKSKDCARARNATGRQRIGTHHASTGQHSHTHTHGQHSHTRLDWRAPPHESQCTQNSSVCYTT